MTEAQADIVIMLLGCQLIVLVMLAWDVLIPKKPKNRGDQ